MRLTNCFGSTKEFAVFDGKPRDASFVADCAEISLLLKCLEHKLDTNY